MRVEASTPPWVVFDFSIWRAIRLISTPLERVWDALCIGLLALTGFAALIGPVFTGPWHRAVMIAGLYPFFGLFLIQNQLLQRVRGVTGLHQIWRMLTWMLVVAAEEAATITIPQWTLSLRLAFIVATLLPFAGWNLKRAQPSPAALETSTDGVKVGEIAVPWEMVRYYVAASSLVMFGPGRKLICVVPANDNRGFLDLTAELAIHAQPLAA